MDNSSFETVSLGDYFGVIWRRKWIVILVTILFGVAGFLYSMHQTEAVRVDVVGALQHTRQRARPRLEGVERRNLGCIADRRRTARQVRDPGPSLH